MIQEITKLEQNFNKSKKESLEWFDDFKDSTQIFKIVDNKPLIKGKFYKFVYKPKNPQKPYDSFPLVLSLGESVQSTNENKLDLCLNFNYLPREVKVYVFKKLFKSFELKIKSQSKQYPLQAYNKKFLDIDYYILKEILKGVNLSFAIQNYIPFNRGETFMLSFDNIYRLPFLENFNFVGTNIQTVEQIYTESLIKNDKKI